MARQKRLRLWPIKIFIFTLIITAGISVVTEILANNISVLAALFIILFIMLIGITADIIGIAFATCEQKPFTSMASKKIKKAKSAIRLLQNADIVSNICGDVIGDICGIVSGAAGATIALKLALSAHETSQIVFTIAVSSIIAAITVSGKAAGKSIAIKNNKQIVSFIAYLSVPFFKDSKS